MSDLNDPRVLFAAERTLLAWSRTAAGLMALGFLIDRSAVLLPGANAHRGLAAWLGLAFVLLAVAVSGVSIAQYRRSLADIRPVEIPPGYWVHLPVWLSVIMALLGLALAAYLLGA
jgi:putative membrane protein